ncbi:MAG TPA: DUF6178 family protein [Polyangia bacterium]|nr:DUF6178 family protein [Polyangia bacterium]
MPKRPTKPPAPPQPDNVVALSRYRAQLGRGRKLRRAEALLAGPDPERAVRALPGDELYYVIHEIGLRDAGDVLALARPEQVRTVLDFALWERDQVVPERAGEWLEAIAEAPYETVGEWVAGLDIELFALLLRQASRIYDLTQEEAPEEPEGIFFPTPDGFFVLDVIGFDSPDAPRGEESPVAPSARALVRIVDSLYRADKDLARRILVGARAEMDSELEELAFRWRQGRMADLGFADYYEALEVYRELDPATVRIGETKPGSARVRPLDDRGGVDAPARAPAALVERLTRGASPFARAAQGLTAEGEIADLHFALVALTNRVLAADRITPGDDAAVTTTLERLLATLDLALDFLARGDLPREVEAVRTVALVRLFRLGVSLAGKVKRLATTLRRRGPFAATGLDLAEREDATILEAVMRARPMVSGLADDPPTGVDRPFRTVTDLARVGAVVERAAAAEALLLGLGVTPGALAPPSAVLEAAGVEPVAVDAGLLARTALVARLLDPEAGPAPLAALAPEDVRDFEALLEHPKGRPARLPEVLRKRAAAILDGATPAALTGAAAPVRERWLASLAPLEPVLVARAPATAT